MRRFVSILTLIGLLLLIGEAQASPPAPASGNYGVTVITGFSTRAAGPNTIIEQTTSGTITGTLSGTFEDEIKAVVHPNGVVGAQGTFTCACMVAGRSGTLKLVQVSIGEFAAEAFEGHAVIVSATGDLRSLHGVLELEGTVGPNGFATVSYSGGIHFEP